MGNKSVYCFLVLLLIAGCGKKETVEPPLTARPLYPHITEGNYPVSPHHPWLPATPAPRPMIETITTTEDNGNIRTEHYYYDDQWRLIKLVYNSPSNVSTDTFSYTNSMVYRNGYGYLTLNAEGLAQEDYLGGGGGWYSQKHYSYNANKNLTYEYSMSGHASYYYSSIFNIDSSSSTTEQGTSGFINYDYRYTYNTQQNTTGNYNKGEYFLGQSSANLVTRQDWTMVYNVPQYTSSANFVLYNYTYNNLGWATHIDENLASVIPNQIDSVTVVYDTTWQHFKMDYTYY